MTQEDQNPQLEEEIKIEEEPTDPEQVETPVTEADTDWEAIARAQAAEAAKWRRLASKPKAPTLPTKKEPVDPELIQKVNRLDEIENKRQFGYDNNLSPEETDAVFKFSNGKPTKEILDNPFVKAGIESLRQAKRVESNTPGSSSRASVFQGKDFSQMTEADRAKAYEERMASLKK